MSVRSRFAAAVIVPALAAAPLLFAAPAAQAAVIDEAEVQVVFHDAAGHVTGFRDLTLIGAGARATVTPPAGTHSALIINDPFPLSEDPVQVTFGITAESSRAADSTLVWPGSSIEVTDVSVDLLGNFEFKITGSIVS
jgi:hypothetical protein